MFLNKIKNTLAFFHSSVDHQHLLTFFIFNGTMNTIHINPKLIPKSNV